MQTLAANLLALNAVKAEDPSVGPLLPLYPILRAMKYSVSSSSGIPQNKSRALKRSQKVIALTTHRCTNHSTGCTPAEFGNAIIFAIPIEELHSMLTDSAVVAAFGDVMMKSGETSTKYLSDLVTAVKTKHMRKARFAKIRAFLSKWVFL
jgi:hypothetical protein